MRRSVIFSVCGFALSVMMPAMAQVQVHINEIRTEEFGSSGTFDTDYFELAGTPNTSLAGMTYLVLGGGSADGQIQSVTDLSSFSLQSDGLFVAAKTGFLLGSPDAEVNFSFSTFNRTHLLVSGFTGHFGDDLDTNDDGTLDTMPWTTIHDAVSLVNQTDPNAYGYNLYYAGSVGYVDVGPDLNDSAGPLHIYRDPDFGGSWVIGPAAPAGLQAHDTPGSPNNTEILYPPGPVPIPLPAAAWMGLGMVGLLGTCRKRLMRK